MMTYIGMTVMLLALTAKLSRVRNRYAMSKSAIMRSIA